MGVAEYKRLDFKGIYDLNSALSIEETTLSELSKDEILSKQERTQKIRETKEKLKP